MAVDDNHAAVAQSMMTRSYSQQFDALQGGEALEVLRSAHPKPSPSANASAPGAYRLPFADVWMAPKQRPLLGAKPKTLSDADLQRAWDRMFWKRWFGYILHHALALCVGPLFFSWRNLAVAEAVRFVTTAIGINLCYHRLLTHRSFRCPKALEYVFAFIGAISGQGGPIEWVSIHRYHHIHCDTPLDPHSPYEGFWWAHMGWIINKEAAVEKPLLDYTNVRDLTSQPFYNWLEVAWFDLMGARMLLTWLLGGWAAVAWTYSVPLVLSWHATFLVNSACHIWGDRPYATGDLSTNNWWVALMAYGEGWHNTHHAFGSSARHGLEWWQFDPTWLVICGLQRLGLAWDVQLPTLKQLEAKLVPSRKLEDGMDMFACSGLGMRIASSASLARASSVGSTPGQADRRSSGSGSGSGSGSDADECAKEE